MAPPGPLVLLTGVQASGKSSVGLALAALAPRGAFLDGDAFWQAVVSGRADMAPGAGAEATAQLHLRYEALACAGRAYARAGFRTVLADNVYGADVSRFRGLVAPLPLRVVALVPPVEEVARRERSRGTSAYAPWTTGAGRLEDAVQAFDDVVRATPADLQHDSGAESVAETAAAIDAWLRASR